MPVPSLVDATKLYGALILKYASNNNLSSSLIAAQIRQESSYDATLVQPGSGALGLMQLMPSSFPQYSEEELLDPENNIKIGVKYLRECIDIFTEESLVERIKFGLAAYNAGAKNIIAAQAMATREKYPSDKWASVGVCLAYVTGLSNALQTNWYVWKILDMAPNWHTLSDGMGGIDA